MTHVGSGEAAGRAAWLVLAAVFASAPLASAQPPPGGMSPAPFVLVEGRGAFERQTVCGAPYSARTETELVQKLADGNRISRRWTGSVARDGEGRVRREHPIAAIGMLMAPADAPRIVVITDPVQRVTWFLEAGTRTARRMAWSSEPGRGAADGKGQPPLGRGGPFGDLSPLAPAPAAESLGAREIAGVRAEGTRTTYVIPAGKIGNERPLSVVSERWFSPELEVVLETREADPRMGETLFRTTSIVRGEPEAGLFRVPEGYVVDDALPPPPMPGAPGLTPPPDH
jgi:hypothetical protein